MEGDATWTGGRNKEIEATRRRNRRNAGTCRLLSDKPLAATLCIVSATDLLEQVKQELQRLPAREREKFFDGLAGLEERLPSSHPTSEIPLAWPDIQARHRRIFGDAVLPENIVLEAREREEH